MSFRRGTASPLLISEGLPALGPGGVPAAAVSCGVKAAGVKAGERALQVADLVVLGPARVDAH